MTSSTTLTPPPTPYPQWPASQSCDGNWPISSALAPWGSSGAWSHPSGSWSTWWGGAGDNSCPPNAGWTSGGAGWSTSGDAGWTWCTAGATTMVTTVYVTGSTGGIISTATSKSVGTAVQVAQQSSVGVLVSAQKSEGATGAGVTVAFGSLAMALLATVLIL